MHQKLRSLGALVEFVKCPKTRRRRGVLVGFKHHDEKVLVGFAGCNPVDTFSRELGLAIAIGRAFNDSTTSPPSYIKKPLERFYKRCRRYFHTDVKPVAIRVNKD